MTLKQDVAELRYLITEGLKTMQAQIDCLSGKNVARPMTLTPEELENLAFEGNLVPVEKLAAIDIPQGESRQAYLKHYLRAFGETILDAHHDGMTEVSLPVYKDQLPVARVLSETDDCKRMRRIQRYLKNHNEVLDLNFHRDVTPILRHLGYTVTYSERYYYNQGHHPAKTIYVTVSWTQPSQDINWADRHPHTL